MSRDSGADQPTQRTVAELLAEYGGSSEKGSRRRRRKPEDPSETAPQEIINRVLSDSGKMRPVKPDEEPPSSRRNPGPANGQPSAAPAGPPPAQQPAAQPPAAQPPAAQAPAAKQPAQPPAGPPPAAQPQQQAQAAGPASPAKPQPAQPASEPPAESGPQPGSAGYWAQRFNSAGGAAATPPAPSAPSNDAEATLRQPALPPARSKPPIAPAGPPQLPENLTEQLPRIDRGADQAYPAQAEPDADPYDYDSFGDSGQVFADDVGYQQSYDEDYDSAAPAGLDDDYDPDEGDRPPSAGKEWGTLALQGVAGLVGGGAVWVGFRWLWINATIAAFGAALVFTGLLVLVAWKFFRTHDLQTILLSVLVGLFCTVSPAALLLINQ